MHEEHIDAKTNVDSLISFIRFYNRETFQIQDQNHEALFRKKGKI